MNKFTLSAAAIAVAFTLAAPAQAAMLFGAKAGADVWFADAEVNEVSTGEDDTAKSMYFAVEHMVPLIPNFRLRYNEVDTPTVAFGQIDYTVYYEILDNDLVALDLGLNIAKFNSGKFQSQSFSEWQPSVYGQAQVGVPMSPLSVFADLNVGSLDGTSTIDGQAGVKWGIGLVAANLNVRAGYRVMDYDFGFLSNNDGKVKLDGWFVGLEVGI